MNKEVFEPLCSCGGKLTAYLHEADNTYIQRGPRPSVLVIPGGGYEKIVDREGDSVAFEFFAAGFNAFVLEYSVRPAGSDELPLGLKPLIQASSAIIQIRKMAKSWNTKEDQIAVIGFSAGGHLAGACASMWNSPELNAQMDTCGGMNRPDAAVMGYPVVLAGELAHGPSIANLAEGNNETFFDLTTHVGNHVPPTFLWTTMEDELVPCENTLSYAIALQRYKIPYELHIYTHGPHGLTLGLPESNRINRHVASWVPLCKRWLGDLFRFDVSI